MTKTEINARMFVESMFDGENLYNKPTLITLEDAEYNLRCYAEEYPEDIPDGMTAELFQTIWNGLCDEARMKEKHKICQRIADSVLDMMRMAGSRKDVTIAHEYMTDECLSRIKEWDRKWLHLLPGEEYYLIHCDGRLLYAVNVTGDAYLTAAEELIRLVAAKF